MQALLQVTAAACSCCPFCDLLDTTGLAAAVLLLLLLPMLLKMKACLGGPARMRIASPAQSKPASHASLLRPAEAVALPNMP